MTRALITGISGFVGRHLRGELICAGWQVFGFDIRPSDEETFTGDLADRTAILHAITESKPDVVFHLAGIIKSDQAEVYYRSNLLGTLNLLDAIMGTELRPRVVLASSSAVYGLTKGSRPITEHSSLRPVTEYAISKAAQEMAALRYYYAFGLPVIIARMFNLLGPGQSPDLVCSAFARQIALSELCGQTEIVFGNLDSRRDFVDVRDAVRALALLGERGRVGQVYNICSGRAVAIRECLNEMISISAAQLSARVEGRRLQKNDVPVQVGGYRKLQEATGWSPEIPIKQSLVDLLNDWRKRVVGTEQNELER